MLALLDPVLLEAQDPPSIEVLADIIRLLRERSMLIPGGGTAMDPGALAKSYEICLMNRFREVGQHKLGNSQAEVKYRQYLRVLRNFVTAVDLPQVPNTIVIDTAIEKIFRPPWLTEKTCALMKQMVASCALSGTATVLVTRLSPERGGEERNARLRQHGHMVNVEKLVWRLRVQRDTNERIDIPCICGSRNLTVPWTRRYDDELPAEQDGAAFPFCPDPRWEEAKDLKVLVTKAPGYAWLDVQGNWWRRPNTPGKGDHWDLVFGSERLRSEYGDKYLNILRWKVDKGAPGSIDHVQTGRRHLLKKETGWRCK